MTTALEKTPKLRLLKEVASGPVSAVFAGETQWNGKSRLVCVKILHANNEAQRQRLLTAYRSAAPLQALNHRHIVSVEDVIHINGHFGLVSEYVDGLDLQDWLDILNETGVTVPKRVICEIIRGIAVGLDTAQNRVPQQQQHPLRLSHNDLKPTNIVVDRDGELKIVDFQTGFTSISGGTARSGALQKGLIRYMAPERQEGSDLEGPGDVYALGIMAIELFRGTWLKRIRNHNPAHDRYLAEVVANLPDLEMRSQADERTLRNILLRMVAHDPESRPEISEVAATFRTLTDRATGPSLESFAHAHAVPWLENIQTELDESLEEYTVDLVEQSLDMSHPGISEHDTTAEGAFMDNEITQSIQISDPTPSTVFDINDSSETGNEALEEESFPPGSTTTPEEKHRASAMWLSVFFFGSSLLALLGAVVLCIVAVTVLIT